MALALTHFILPVFFLELFRRFYIKSKSNFPIGYVYIAGFAALLPDFDFALDLIAYLFKFSSEFHKTFTHTLWVPLIFLVGASIFYLFKKRKLRDIFFLLSFGTFSHLILDLPFAKMNLLYPILNLPLGIDLVSKISPATIYVIAGSIDAVLLIIWMLYFLANEKLDSFL